jgi:hypothetical protein
MWAHTISSSKFLEYTEDIVNIRVIYNLMHVHSLFWIQTVTKKGRNFNWCFQDFGAIINVWFSECDTESSSVKSVNDLQEDEWLWTGVMLESVRFLVVQCRLHQGTFCVGSIIALCQLITAIQSGPHKHNTRAIIQSFVLILCGTLWWFVGPSSDTGYDHMLQKRSPFLVCMQDRHLVCPYVKEQWL